jgi:transposase
LGVIYKKHRRQTMHEPITGFVGLDVHTESTAIGFAAAGREAPRFVGTVGPRLTELRKALGRLGEPRTLLIVYEAGPCGYGLARELIALEYRCEVVAPSRIPRQPADRVKTDRRDALKLASLARAAELVPISIPDERDEAIRDLSRARVDAVRAQVRQENQSPSIRAIAWRAQLRLSHRYRRLRTRGLHHNKICVAIARELTGFIWDIGRQVDPSH